MLFITPEKLGASGKLQSTLDSLYQRGQLARVVVDEASMGGPGTGSLVREPDCQPVLLGSQYVQKPASHPGRMVLGCQQSAEVARAPPQQKAALSVPHCAAPCSPAPVLCRPTA